MQPASDAAVYEPVQDHYETSRGLAPLLASVDTAGRSGEDPEFGGMSASTISLSQPQLYHGGGQEAWAELACWRIVVDADAGLWLAPAA